MTLYDEDRMTDQERIALLEDLLADYVFRYGALREASDYFVDVSRTIAGDALEQHVIYPTRNTLEQATTTHSEKAIRRTLE